jgi:hypothetical protein
MTETFSFLILNKKPNPSLSCNFFQISRLFHRLSSSCFGILKEQGGPDYEKIFQPYLQPTFNNMSMRHHRLRYHHLNPRRTGDRPAAV